MAMMTTNASATMLARELLRLMVVKNGDRKFELVRQPNRVPENLAGFHVDIKTASLEDLEKVAAEFIEKIPPAATRCYQLAPSRAVEQSYSFWDIDSGLCVRVSRFYDVTQNEILTRADCAFA